MESSRTSQESFPKTSWTLVAKVGQEAAPEVREQAISELCETYWPPIYAFLRSKGNSQAEAEDLTQGFFEDFLRRENFSKATPERGKLRSFLLTSVVNYEKQNYRKEAAQKRGGGQPTLSLDATDFEGNPLVLEPIEAATPESAFHKQWALTLLNRVLESLREIYVKKGKLNQFEALNFVISTGQDARAYSDVALQLGCSEGSVKVAAHRLRARYQRTLRETIADTLLLGEEVDDELRELMAAFD